MLFTIAWRNLIRHRRRSMIVLISIIVGVVALMFNDSLSYGMIRQMLDNAIGSSIGHIQVHGKGFNENRVIQNFIPDRDRAERAVREATGVGAWSSRVVTFGLLSSAMGSSGGIIVGVDPAREGSVSTIQGSIIEGRYLEGEGREVVIGKKLAEKLHAGLGDKVVGMASALDGDVGSELFRIVGIYETVSSDFDRTHIFVPLPAAQRMLGIDTRIIEITITSKNIEELDGVAVALRSALGDGYEVHTYKQLLPILVAQLEMYDQMLYVIYLIIGLAMIFGIINTMLMSVFERIQEFGVLMAIGMRNSRVFAMVMAEAICLAGVGTVCGLISGILVTLPLSYIGIDLSMFSDGLASFGTGAIIYPVLRFNGIMAVVVTIPLTTMFGALYPAWKATRLQPVQAIRHI